MKKIALFLVLTACAPRAGESLLSETLDGAKEADQSDPIAAASVIITSKDGVPLCNGVLLSDGMIATAASCADGKPDRFRVNANGAALVPVLEVIKAEQIAFLKVKFEALPQTSRAIELAAGGTNVDGTLRLATFLRNSNKVAVAPGKIDQPESLPGYLALRLDAGGRLSEKQLGSGIYADKDGKTVLVGLFTKPLKRGNIVFVEDMRGRAVR